MAVELSDVQYGIAMNALRKIATGGEWRDDQFKRLTKEQLINLAREACDSWKLSYGQQYSLGQYRSDIARLEQSAKPIRDNQ